MIVQCRLEFVWTMSGSSTDTLPMFLQQSVCPVDWNCYLEVRMLCSIGNWSVRNRCAHERSEWCLIIACQHFLRLTTQTTSLVISRIVCDTNWIQDWLTDWRTVDTDSRAIYWLDACTRHPIRWQRRWNNNKPSEHSMCHRHSVTNESNSSLTIIDNHQNLFQ